MADNLTPNANDIASILNAAQTPQGATTLNIAQQRGNDIATGNAILQDRNNLDPFTFSQKYGPEITGALDQIDLNKASTQNLQNTDRGTNRTISDALSNIGIGVINSAGGAVTLGARLFGRDAAQTVADTVQADIGLIQGNQSQGSKNAQALDAINTQLDKADNDAQYAKDLQNDGRMSAELRSFGRGFTDAAARMWENPVAFQGNIAQGIGSVLAAAPTAGSLKALSTVGRSTVGLAAREAEAPVAASIGLMEGGGAYAQTSQQVMQMTHDQLMAGSPTYAGLINAGVSQDEAKSMVADNAGLQAASIQGPVAALTGKLVERFEAHPLGSFSAKEAAQNIGKEGVEEGLQNLTGQLSQNIGIQQNADQNQRITDDLGTQTAQGAILGALSAGAIQAPGLTLGSAVKNVGKAADYVINRGNNIADNMVQSAPNSEANVSQGIQIAQEQVPAVTQSLQTLVDQAPEAQKTQAQDYINKVQDSLTVPASELTKLPPHQLEQIVNDAGGQRPDLMQAMVSMARTARDENQTPEDRASAALFVAQQIKRNSNLFNEDLPAFLDNVSHDNEHYQTFENYGKLVNAIGSIPSIQEALTKTSDPKLISDIDITDNNIQTSAVQQTIQNVAAQANLQPQNVNPDLAQKVLYQSDRGNVTLSDEQKAQIKSSIALVRAGQAYDQTMEIKPEPETNVSDIVSQQISVTGGNQPWQKSMEQHVRGINDAISANNEVDAQNRMQALNMFAQGMANKVDALNRSVISGSKEQYVSAGPNNQWLPEAKQYKAIVHPGNPGSENFAKRVAAEANMVATLANNMAEIYPQFNMPKVEVPSLVLQKPTEAPVEANTPKQVETTTNSNEVSSEAPKSVPSEPRTETQTGPTTETVRNAPQQSAERATGIAEPASSTEAPAQKETIETRYPKLVNIGDNQGKNQFHEAFTLPDTEKSRISRLTNPINELRDLLKTPKQLVEFMGQDVKYALSQANLEALDEIMSLGTGVMRAMNARAKELLNATTKKGGSSLLDLVAAGQPVNRFKRGRVLNIMDRSGQGLIYNKQLVQSAILAGINQSINGDKYKSNIDKEAAADIVGTSLDRITDDLVNDLNRGMSVADFKRNLAQNITDYWGVNTNNKTSLSQTQGIPEAVAAEVMHGLDAIGLISLGSVEFHDGDVNFTQNRVYFDNRDEALVNEIAKLGAASKLLDSMILTERKAALGANIGEPSGIIPRTQLRSPNVLNTAQQREALANEASTPYYPNMVMHSFMQRMGLENFIRFMGGQRYQEGDLNINHERSMEGTNRTLEYSYQNVMNHMEEVRAYADKAGSPIEEMPTYYDFNMSKVGRMQMQGNNNPQSDKLAREIFMPTRSILDMTNEQDQAKFWMTVAQGIGIKTEKISRADAVNEAQELTLNGKYRPIIDQMVEWLDQKGELPNELTDQIIDAMGSDASMHGLHGLLSVAQYIHAVEHGADLTKYQHFNYLEADGKTNGPIMTTALFASRITGDVIRILRKGGIFLGETNRSLNDHIAKRDPADLYEATTVATAEFQDAFRNRYADEPKVINRLNTLLKVMSALNANISFDENTNSLTLKRGVTKNPLTISIYGSGIDGIAGKVANELLDGIYEKFSELAQNGGKLDDLTYNEFTNDLKELISEQVNQSFEGDISFGSPKGSQKGGRSNSPQDFTFTPAQFNALKSHVRVFFVNQMHAGIHDQILQHVEQSTNELQKATNLQSIFLTGAFRQAIVDKMLALRSNPDYRQGDFLSQNDLDQIYKDLRPLSPIVNTGTQNFFIAGSQKSDIMPSVTIKDADGNDVKIAMPDSFSTALDDSLSSPAYVFGPDIAGVKGVPSLVIGTGDGMIMQNTSVMRDAPKGTLKVFDGINLPATDIDESSRKVNQSVYKAMTANPMQAVADSFNTFLANDPVEHLLGSNAIQEVKDFVINEVSRAISGSRNPKELLSIDEIRQALKTTADNLNNLALETEARNLVLGELDMSVDQMASAESPFSKEGNLNTSFDADQMADILNERQDQVLAALKEGKKKAPAIEEQTNEMRDSLSDVTTPAEGGAQIATIPSLLIWLQNRAKGMNTDQKDLMGTALTSLKDSGYRILFGSRAQLDTYEANTYPEYFTANSYLGKIIPEIRHMFISNITGETLLHELVHAATLDKVIGYYDNPSALDAPDREALKRIEGLMGEWLTQSTEADSEALNTARLAATNQVAGYLQEGNKALAVNEFMAWALSNQELIKSQKKVAVRNPLFRIIGDALSALKSLIWGRRGPTAQEDLFSNLRFNTRILMKTPTPIELIRRDMRKTAIFQSEAFGSNPRLTEIRNAYVNKLSQYIIDPTETNSRGRELDVSMANVQALKALHGNVAAAFGMNQQEASTFTAIHTAMALNTGLNSNALSRAQDIYSHVIDKITVEDLMNNPNSDNPADRYKAQEQFNIITGSNTPNIDKEGRSDRLNTFVALAMVDENFRRYLRTLDNPNSEKLPNNTLDNVLNNIGSYAIDELNQRIAGDTGSKNVKDAIDQLSLIMSQATNEDALFYEKYTVGGLDKIDEILKDNIEQLSDKVYNSATNIMRNTDNRAVKIGAGLVGFAAGIINNRNAEQLAKGIISGSNNSPSMPQVLHDFVVEMIGRTNENKSVIDQVSEGRAAIQQTRQQFIENVPQLLGSKFKTPLTDEQKTHLFYGLGKTDSSSLESRYGVAGTLELASDQSKRTAEIGTIENLLKSQDLKRADKWIEKSKQLANYMITGDYGVNLLRNAIAITHLFGERGFNPELNEDVYKSIDNLVTLYAMDGLNEETKTSISDLIKNEPEGMNYLQSYLVGTHKDEQSHLTTDEASINHYKGYVPSTNQQGVSLMVSNTTEDVALQQLGYERMKTYQGSSIDRSRVDKAYYFSPVSARATYNQGAMQMVHQTVSGIQPGTGYTIENIAGRITDPKTIASIRNSIRNQKGNTTEQLLPVYSADGSVVAYERSMDPQMIGLLNKNTDIMQMTGVWNGRQVEESLARAFNEHLVDNLHDIWINNPKNKSEFVDISKSQDPVHKDAWKIIPQDVKNYITNKFGKDGFHIRKDMINNAIGYRQASIGDAWTGNNRLTDSTNETVKNIAMGIFGKDAFKKLVGAERMLQHLVGEAKTLIVVKSVVVPLGNAIANVYQLMGRGIPLSQIGKSFASKTAEINAYVERRRQEITLQADLRAAEGNKDNVAIRKLTNRIVAIQDSYKRMSIYPLIKAGEFSVISDGGVQVEDLKISNFIDKVTDYLPDRLQTPYRYAMITKDTPIFRFLAQSVQYGDFVAKATMYDYLTQKKGMSEEKAMGAISEEFVNYNLLAGRVRNYTDSVGLAWFWNFKIRSTKVAMSMIRNNPARALLGGFATPNLPLVGHVGTPMQDNIITAALHGNLTYSLGFGPSFRAPTLNPWVNILR